MLEVGLVGGASRKQVESVLVCSCSSKELVVFIDYAYFMNLMFSFHGCLEDSHDFGPSNRSTKPGGKAWRFEGSQGAGGGIHDLTRGECHR